MPARSRRKPLDLVVTAFDCVNLALCACDDAGVDSRFALVTAGDCVDSRFALVTTRG
jgi:hypothetical protein